MKCEKCKKESQKGLYSTQLSFFFCYWCVLNKGIVGHPMIRVCVDGVRNAKKDWGEETWEEFIKRDDSFVR